MGLVIHVDDFVEAMLGGLAACKQGKGRALMGHLLKAIFKKYGLWRERNEWKEGEGEDTPQDERLESWTVSVVHSVTWREKTGGRDDRVHSDYKNAVRPDGVVSKSQSHTTVLALRTGLCSREEGKTQLQ